MPVFHLASLPSQLTIFSQFSFSEEEKSKLHKEKLLLPGVIIDTPGFLSTQFLYEKIVIHFHDAK